MVMLFFLSIGLSTPVPMILFNHSSRTYLLKPTWTSLSSVTQQSNPAKLKVCPAKPSWEFHRS